MIRMLRVLWLGLALSLLNVAAGHAEEDWGAMTPEELGISADEFVKVKESGMPKSKLLHLLEVGVSPNEYFSEPWKKLGVSEDHWMNEKTAGMEDDDINRAYRKQQSNVVDPLIAFVLPGYYHYKTKKLYWGLGLSTTAAACIALTFLHQDKETKNETHIRPIYPIGLLVTMIVSSGYALVHTRYVDNQEAQRFSWDAGPTLEGGMAARLALRF